MMELESANQSQCFSASLPICDEMGLLCVRGGHIGFHRCWYHAAVDERSIRYVSYDSLILLYLWLAFHITVLCTKFTVLFQVTSLAALPTLPIPPAKVRKLSTEEQISYRQYLFSIAMFYPIT
jgi:hypothetical protein